MFIKYLIKKYGLIFLKWILKMIGLWVMVILTAFPVGAFINWLVPTGMVNLDLGALVLITITMITILGYVVYEIFIITLKEAFEEYKKGERNGN